MDEQTSKKREALRQRYEHESEWYLDHIKTMHGADALEGSIANEILTERRRESRRSARIIAYSTVVTAIATIAAALAAWTAIYFQFVQTRTAPNEPPQPTATIKPIPTP